MKLIKSVSQWSTCIVLSTSAVMAQDSVKERRQKGQKAELFYNAAEQSYLDGDIAAAMTSIRAALAIDRGHGRTIALARKIEAGGGDRAVLLLRKRTVRGVVLPLIDIEDSSLRDALKVLSNAIEKASDDKVIPNFVIQDRKKLMDSARITMKLRSMPAGNVLDHILSEVNGYASYGKYSIEIRTRSTSSSTKKEEPVVEQVEEDKTSE